jgi:hypothetical protein
LLPHRLESVPREDVRFVAVDDALSSLWTQPRPVE